MNLSRLQKRLIQLKPLLYRFLSLFLSLGFGAYLIEKHSTLDQTLLGMAFWGVAMFLLSGLLPSVPGLPAFSKTSLRVFKGKKEWGWGWSLLAGAAVLGVLELSDLSVQQGRWLPFVVSVVGVGGILFLLERYSSAFWGGPPDEGDSWLSCVPWPEITVLLLGTFFLFYKFGQIPNYLDQDCMWAMQEGHQFSVGVHTTPFATGFWGGDEVCFFPIMLLGLVFKVLGVSLLKAVVVYSLLNLTGFLFFYGFLRFYLSRSSALTAALLYSASHWVIEAARYPFFSPSLSLPVEAASLYFFVRALEKGRGRDFICFGTVLGLGLISTAFSHIYFFLLLGALAILGIHHRKELLRQGKSWIVGWSVCLLWFLPMILYFIFEKHDYFLGLGRTFHRVSIISTVHGEANLDEVWDNLRWFFSIFTVSLGGGTVFTMTNIPFLSPWEGLCLWAGLGWCLWRFWKPPFALLFLGLIGSVIPPLLTSEPHPLRTLGMVPFVYSLIGIGLDRLSRVVVGPLGSRGNLFRYGLLAFFLVFSVEWQYDVYFHQMPKSKMIWTYRQGLEVLGARTLTTYPPGWDLYSLPDAFFGFDVSVFANDGAIGKMVPFYPTAALPLENLPTKGAVILLPDEFGRAFKNWIHFYYPESNPKQILNPQGDTSFWLWEIKPEQIQKALLAKWRRPPGGLRLICYDSKDRKVIDWRIPALLPDMNYWFRQFNGQPTTRRQLELYTNQEFHFRVEGLWLDPSSEPLKLIARGPVEGTVGNRRIRIKKGALVGVKLRPADSQGDPIQLDCDVTPNDFYLFLEQKDLDGWSFTDSDNLRPAAKPLVQGAP